MEIVRCEKGHFYDAEQCTSCPTCAQAMGGARVPAEEYGATEPLNSGDVMGTSFFDDNLFSTDNIGTPAGFGETVPLDPMGTKVQSSAVEDYGQTMPVPMGGTSAPAASGDGAASVFNPVVGWLVCVDGPSRGTDFRIRSQYNYIGRAVSMDIVIPNDKHVSAEKAAILAYDDQEKLFSFGPGSGHNIVRVNGKMVMNAVELHPYDELTIGMTKLMFVPLCGERFDWNDK